MKEVYEKPSALPISLRSVSDYTVLDLKDEAYRKILTLRNDPRDENDANATEKKMKFVRFIMNLQAKTGFRKWKEEVFGQKGLDAVFKRLLIDERDTLRRRFYDPAKERHKNIKELHRQRIKTNRETVLLIKGFSETI
jgi:hypothetical protein